MSGNPYRSANRDVNAQFTVSSYRFTDLDRGTVTFSKAMSQTQVMKIRNPMEMKFFPQIHYRHLKQWENIYFYNLNMGGERLLFRYHKEVQTELKLAKRQCTFSFRRNHIQDFRRNTLLLTYPFYQGNTYTTYYRSVLDRQKIYDFMRGLNNKAIEHGQVRHCVSNATPQLLGVRENLLEEARKIVFQGKTPPKP